MGWLSNLKYGVVVAAVIAYVAMPPLVFPDILGPILFMFGLNAVKTLIGSTKLTTINLSTKRVKLAKKTTAAVAITLLILIVLLWIISPYISLTQTKELNALPHATLSGKTISSTDPQQIRQVSQEFAQWKADKVIGELGNRFSVADVDIQIYQKRLTWVAPLEFSNFWKWLQVRYSPSYVIVDAENPKKEVERIDNKKMRYMESSYFQSNIYRHVYQQFPFYRLQEFTFEIDDAGNPWWSVGATVPTVWTSGEKVIGVILINPETGDMQFTTNPPEWVDRVVPETLAENYNRWFGAYKHGFWNSLFTQKDMHLPTEKYGQVDVFAVRSGNDLVWFTGHTSPSVADLTLVGYSTMNTRTGEFVYYGNVSGYYSEEAALSNANSKVSNFPDYWGTQPVFYNIFGELSWIIPILSGNNELQRIAIVHAKTGNVVLGETLDEALKEYKQWLHNSGGAIVETEESSTLTFTEGTVARITENYLVLTERDPAGKTRIFDIQFVKNIEKEITQTGDRVKLGYSGTNAEENKSIVEVKEFDNLNFILD